jgi:glycine/D-amino acid oxidase-like deaminating enzyme
MDPGDQSFPALDSDVEVDLAVIGGGFSGLGAAWAASQQGATVALLEARSIASGASGRNAGFVLAGPAMGFRESVRLAGLQSTLDIWQLTQDNHSLITSLVDDLGAECGYVRRGSLCLAASEAEWEEMQEECTDMVTAGLHVCRVPASDLPRPFDRMYFGGVYYAGNGEMNPGAFLRSLATSLGSNVRIFEASPVRSMSGPGGVALELDRGRVRARRAVVATNAYTSALLPDLPIAPTRGQVASTLPARGVVVPFPMYADRGFQYWRQAVGGQIVVGGWRNMAADDEIGTEQNLHRGIQQTLDRFLARVAPEAAVEHRWAGIMGFTPDHFPLVGPIPGRPELSIAAGYSGHGVAMAFICGALAARTALNVPASIPSPFSPGRFDRAA